MLYPQALRLPLAAAVALCLAATPTAAEDTLCDRLAIVADAWDALAADLDESLDLGLDDAAAGELSALIDAEIESTDRLVDLLATGGSATEELATELDLELHALAETTDPELALDAIDTLVDTLDAYADACYEALEAAAGPQTTEVAHRATRLAPPRASSRC